MTSDAFWSSSKSELKILIPSQLRSDDDAYFSIYNKTTNQYNVLPEIAGEYEIYAMKYDKSDKHLEIHKFNYLPPLHNPFLNKTQSFFPVGKSQGKKKCTVESSV